MKDWRENSLSLISMKVVENYLLTLFAKVLLSLHLNSEWRLIMLRKYRVEDFNWVSWDYKSQQRVRSLLRKQKTESHTPSTRSESLIVISTLSRSRTNSKSLIYLIIILWLTFVVSLLSNWNQSGWCLARYDVCSVLKINSYSHFSH